MPDATPRATRGSRRFRFRTRTLLVLMTATALVLWSGVLLRPEPPALAEPIPILGPITSGGDASAIGPPSDQEVLKALSKVAPETRRMSALTAKVVKTRVSDYVDPVRVYPIIGPAQQHHAQYKCEVTFGGPLAPMLGERRVVYVDYNHLHRTSPEPEATANLAGMAP